MKSEVILCLLFGLSVRAAFFEKEQRECLNELKLDAAAMNAIDSLTVIPLPNEDFGKLKACVFIKKGILTHRGRILWEATVKAVAAELKSNHESTKQLSDSAINAEVEKVLKLCKNADLLADLTGDVAIKLRNCFVKASTIAQGLVSTFGKQTGELAKPEPNLPEITPPDAAQPKAVGQDADQTQLGVEQPGITA